MSNHILRLTLLASLLLVVSIFFLYRGTGWPLGVQGSEALIACALLLAVTIALFLYRRRTWHTDSIYQRSVQAGLVIGLLWTAEISMNNILAPELPLRDILDDLFWAAVALAILIVSVYYAYQTNSILIGIKVGFWSGLSSGAVACLTALLFIVVGMYFILHDPLNIQEWSAVAATSGTPSMAVYFAYQTLAGALLHLIALGAIMGVLLGLVGGVIGKVGSVLVKKRTFSQLSQ